MLSTHEVRDAWWRGGSGLLVGNFARPLGTRGSHEHVQSCFCPCDQYEPAADEAFSPGWSRGRPSSSRRSTTACYPAVSLSIPLSLSAIPLRISTPLLRRYLVISNYLQLSHTEKPLHHARKRGRRWLMPHRWPRTYRAHSLTSQEVSISGAFSPPASRPTTWAQGETRCWVAEQSRRRNEAVSELAGTYVLTTAWSARCSRPVAAARQ